MQANTLTEFKDLLHAQLCYQLFITPIHFPIDKEYRNFARLARAYFIEHRSAQIHLNTPRHHVLHHFEQVGNGHAKKVLIAHGWMSRAAYMVRLVRSLHRQGYQVYALDFPAHGEAKGLQLTWTEAVTLLKQLINDFGPFYALIGHSFGGSMVLNTLTLASQFPDWKIQYQPERVVLISSPTRMRTPVYRLARRLRLSGKGFLFLRELFRQHAFTDLKNLDFRHFANQSKTPFLCIHGENDHSIKPKESTIFCQQYPHARLVLLPGADHISVLLDERVDHQVCDFLA